MKILFISLGCDKNLVDTEVMLGILISFYCNPVCDPLFMLQEVTR